MSETLRVIKTDHQVVGAMFKKYRAMGSEAYRIKDKLATTILSTLLLQTKTQEVLSLIADLKMTQPEDPRFEVKMTALQDLIEHEVIQSEGMSS